SCSTPTAVTPGSTRTPPSTGTRWPRANTPTRPTPAGSPTAEGTGVILRFGWFYGPGAAHSEQILPQARLHIFMTPRRPLPGPTDTSQAKAQGRTGHQG